MLRHWCHPFHCTPIATSIASTSIRAWSSPFDLCGHLWRPSFNSVSLTFACRWAASLSHRNELLDERRCRPKPQWRRLQPRSQPQRSHARQLDLHEQPALLRSFPVPESTTSTEDAERRRDAQWLPCLQQSRISDQPCGTCEETTTKGRQLGNVAASSTWYAAKLAITNTPTSSISRVPSERHSTTCASATSICTSAEWFSKCQSISNNGKPATSWWRPATSLYCFSTSLLPSGATISSSIAITVRSRRSD